MPVFRKPIILRCVGAVAGFLVFAFVSGIAVGYLKGSGVAIGVGTMAFWFAALAATGVMGASIWVGALWMRSIDEAAREAHKAAWYWGGSSGMAVGGVFMILAVLPGAGSVSLPVMDGRTDPAAYAAMGAFGLMMLMIIGYTIVWAWWWLARR